MNAQPQYITDSIGNKTAVILPIADRKPVSLII
jgi:hypothetical protein